MNASQFAGLPPHDDRAGPSHGGEIARDLAVGLLCIAIVWAPLSLGATGEWPRLGLEATITAAVVVWAAVGRSSAWAMLLPVGVLFTALLQVMPLPDRMLVAIAPISGGAWKIALAGASDGWGRISVDPAATAIAARRLFLGAALINAVAEFSQSRRQRMWLTSALTVAAVAIIAAGLLFPVARDQRIVLGFIDLRGPIEWWRTPLVSPVQSGGWAYIEDVCAGEHCYKSDLAIVGDAFGSYICCNKFAGAVCLTLPVAVGAFLFWSRRTLPPLVRYSITLGVFVAALWILGSPVSSRAGFAALLASALVFYSLAVEHRRLRLVASIGAAGYGLFVLIFVAVLIGQFRSLASILPQPLDEKIGGLLSDGRAVAAHAAARMFAASPILGTGLATFDDLWPRMMPGPTTWYYAHNDYAQAIAETGLVGCTSLLAFAVWLVRGFLRFARDASFPNRLMDAGPWAGLTAIAVHSAFDWNLHVPANAFLACVICGLAVGSAQGISMPILPSRDRSATRLVARAMFITVSFTTLALLARDAWTDAAKHRLREAIVAQRIAVKDPGSPHPSPGLLAAIAAGNQAVRWSPHDPRLHVLLAQANVHLAAIPAPGGGAENRDMTDFLDRLKRHSEAALRASPTIRGIPEQQAKPLNSAAQ